MLDRAHADPAFHVFHASTSRTKMTTLPLEQRAAFAAAVEESEEQTTAEDPDAEREKRSATLHCRVQSQGRQDSVDEER